MEELFWDPFLLYELAARCDSCTLTRLAQVNQLSSQVCKTPQLWLDTFRKERPQLTYLPGTSNGLLPCCCKRQVRRSSEVGLTFMPFEECEDAVGEPRLRCCVQAEEMLLKCLARDVGAEPQVQVEWRDLFRYAEDWHSDSLEELLAHMEEQNEPGVVLMQPGEYLVKGGFLMKGHVCLFGLPFDPVVYGVNMRCQDSDQGSTPCSKNQVVIRASEPKVILSNAGYAQLWNLVLLQEAEGKGNFCINSVKNMMLVENCYLSSSGLSAVGVQTSAVWLQNCTVAECGQAGVFGFRDAKLSLRRCLISDSAMCGVAILEKSLGYVRDSLLRRCGGNGINVAKGSNVVAVHSHITECAENGLRITDTCSGSMRECQVSRCKQMGVRCEKKEGRVTFYGCSFRENEHNGIYIAACGGKFMLAKNEFVDNQQGLEILSTQAMIFQNNFSGNKYGHLVVRNGCKKIAIGQNVFRSGPEALRIGLNASFDFCDNVISTGRVTLHAVAGEETDVERLMELLQSSNQMGHDPANVVVFQRGEDEIRSAALQNKCTIVYTGRSFFKQSIYACATCAGLNVCYVCAKICHKGHDLITNELKVAAYCHCSEAYECSCG